MNIKKILFYALAALGGGAFADNPIAVKPTLAELPATFQILPEKDCYDLSFIAQCDEGSGKIEAVIAFWKNGEEMSSERGGNISLRFDINSTTVCSSPVQIPHGADSAKIRIRAFLDLSANINVCNVRFMPGLDSAENSGARKVETAYRIRVSSRRFPQSWTAEMFLAARRSILKLFCKRRARPQKRSRITVKAFPLPKTSTMWIQITGATKIVENTRTPPDARGQSALFTGLLKVWNPAERSPAR